ncbi:MAG: YIP1 family protein [Chloroherpetonaceae bacterium]|nr:YIP1 family protein [Chloroherpetonaceae bacterium]MDW8437197.1 YIP1 family protein [Chloroherpetonaceae bacterium]
MLFQRMLRAAKLDVSLYEEVEADQTALGQAMLVVVLHGVAAGIGSYDEAGATGLVFGTIGQLIGWFVWALVTYLVGAKLLPEAQTHADLGQLLRTIGFSAAPGLLLALGVIPFVGGIIAFIAQIWMLITFVIAVRQALDYNSTVRAVAVCVLGWLLMVAITAALMLIFGGFLTK